MMKTTPQIIAASLSEESEMAPSDTMPLNGELITLSVAPKETRAPDWRISINPVAAMIVA